jgi:hypothetical protein
MTAGRWLDRWVIAKGGHFWIPHETDGLHGRGGRGEQGKACCWRVQGLNAAWSRRASPRDDDLGVRGRNAEGRGTKAVHEGRLFRRHVRPKEAAGLQIEILNRHKSLPSPDSTKSYCLGLSPPLYVLPHVIVIFFRTMTNNTVGLPVKLREMTSVLLCNVIPGRSDHPVAPITHPHLQILYRI